MNLTFERKLPIPKEIKDNLDKKIAGYTAVAFHKNF